MMLPAPTPVVILWAIACGLTVALQVYMLMETLFRICHIALHPTRKATARFVCDFPNMPMPSGVKPVSGILHRVLAWYRQRAWLFYEPLPY